MGYLQPKRSRDLVVAVAAFGLLSLASAQEAKVVGVYTLPPVGIATLNPQLSAADVQQAYARGWPTSDRPGIGSGLYYLGNGRFLGLTDRGPNGDCPEGKSGLFFPLPGYAPTLVPFRLDQANRLLRLEEPLPLRALGGRLLSGLPSREDQQNGYSDSSCTAVLPKDPGGGDPEDVAVLPGGRGYLVVEENAPALLYLDAKGTVQMGYVPKGVQIQAPYPIRDTLPRVLALRRENRGLENLALSGDGKTAWVVLQSPIGSTKDSAYGDSLVARAVRLDVSNPLEVRVTGLYLVPFSDPKEYPKPNKPKDMKYSAAAWVSEERILLLERASGGARVFLVDFSQATNLLEHPLGDTPELDKVGTDYGALGIHLPQRKLLLETWKLPEFDTDKLEGLTLLEDGRTLAIANDNDFAITGREGPSRLWLVLLPQALR